MSDVRGQQQQQQLPSTLVHELKGHTGVVNTIRWNSDGSYCMSGGHDKLVKLWNPFTGTLIKTYEGFGREVFTVAITNDNGKFASGGADKNVFLWDVASARVLQSFRGHYGRINSVVFNSNCSVIVSASYDATVRCWDVRSKLKDAIQTMEDAKDSVSSVCIRNSEIITASVDGKVRVYDIRMGSLITDTLGSPLTCVNISNDGNCILASTLDSKVCLLDKESGETLNQYSGHQNTGFKIESCFNNTDAVVMSGSEDGRLYFWDVLDGTTLCHVERAHRGTICSLAHHPKRGALLSSGVDGMVRLWGPKAGIS